MLEHELLTSTGKRITVAQVVSTMQQKGVDQKLIDRWLQGLEAGIDRRN